MIKGPQGKLILKYGEEIIPAFFSQPDFNIMVHAKIHSQQIIELPAKLVILQGRYNTQQSGLFKEGLCQVLVIQ